MALVARAAPASMFGTEAEAAASSVLRQRRNGLARRSQQQHDENEQEADSAAQALAPCTCDRRQSSAAQEAACREQLPGPTAAVVQLLRSSQRGRQLLQHLRAGASTSSSAPGTQAHCRIAAERLLREIHAALFEVEEELLDPTATVTSGHNSLARCHAIVDPDTIMSCRRWLQQLQAFMLAMQRGMAAHDASPTHSPPCSRCGRYKQQLPQHQLLQKQQKQQELQEDDDEQDLGNKQQDQEPAGSQEQQQAARREGSLLQHIAGQFQQVVAVMDATVGVEMPAGEAEEKVKAVAEEEARDVKDVDMAEAEVKDAKEVQEAEHEVKAEAGPVEPVVEKAAVAIDDTMQHQVPRTQACRRRPAEALTQRLTEAGLRSKGSKRPASRLVCPRSKLDYRTYWAGRVCL